jgi:glutathione synthase/RimK-type ligase-like ATP-grasp enzyme
VIVVVGGLADTVTELVCARLTDCGYPYRFVDLGAYPAGHRVSWHRRDSTLEGWIETDGWRLDLDEVTGVYARYLGTEGRVLPPGVAPASAPAMYFEHDSGLMTLLEDLPCPVVNRLAGGMSNSSKPYQALLVRRCGLLTPSTLVSNDPEAVRVFYDRHRGEVVYKSLSGIRSIVRRLQPEQLDRLPLLRHGPAQFQAFVPGENVRVHTVGDRVFACRVRTEAVDYRYGAREGQEVTIEPTAVPPAVEQACLRLAGELDLLFAGIDLKQTPDGDYYCFEVNPSPGFLYYEQQTGQPISAALADLLQHGLRPRMGAPEAPVR